MGFPISPVLLLPAIGCLANTMDTETFDLLSDRLSGLELHLNTASEQDYSQQLLDLRKTLSKAFASNSDLQTLTKIIGELGLWDKFNADGAVSSEAKETGSPEVDDEAKSQVILAKYPAIRDAYNNLTRLSTMDIPRLINYVENSQDKTHDFYHDLLQISRSQDRVENLVSSFHILVVKNMIVLEKYVDLVVRENEFWVDIEGRIAILRRQQLKKQERVLRENKY